MIASLAVLKVAALAAGLAADRACLATLAPSAAEIVCAAPGIRSDLSALRAAGVPETTLQTAMRRCRRETEEEAAYACARDAIWRAAGRAAAAADPESRTGLYRADGDAYGELTVIERTDGTVRLTLRTRDRASGHTCRLDIANAWRSEREIAWKGEVAPGASDSLCDVSLRSMGRDLQAESAQRCAWSCGAKADYAFTYRQQR